MIAVSLTLGGVVGNAILPQLETLHNAGEKLGLAFQIVDDILDVTADTATLGKTAGKDAKAGKTTYVKLHGIDASRQFARQHTAEALAAIRSLPGDHAFLSALVDSMVSRIN
jgi:geranylgeranyl pyrophosphate synthase